MGQTVNLPEISVELDSSAPCVIIREQKILSSEQEAGCLTFTSLLPAVSSFHKTRAALLIGEGESGRRLWLKTSASKLSFI